MKKYADMVRGTTTTEGTGTLTLGATPDGFFGFADVLANSDPCSILIVDNPNAPAQWELCESVFSSGTLTRGRILASSTGSRVDFDPGTKIVQLVATSDDYRTVAENLDSNLVLGGSGGAYTIESQRDVEPYEGLTFVAVVNHTNPAEPTLVWNDEDPADILGPDGEALAEGVLIEGRACTFRFDGAAWRVVAGMERPSLSFETASIPRSVGDRSRDYLDAMEYVEIDTVEDQSAGLQAAIDEATALGRRLVFPRGGDVWLQPNDPAGYKSRNTSSLENDVLRAVTPKSGMWIDGNGVRFRVIEPATVDTDDLYYLFASDWGDDVGDIENIRLDDVFFYLNQEEMPDNRPVYAMMLVGFDNFEVNGGGVLADGGSSDNARGFTLWNGRSFTHRNAIFRHVRQGCYLAYVDRVRIHGTEGRDFNEGYDFDLVHRDVQATQTRWYDGFNEAQPFDVASAIGVEISDTICRDILTPAQFYQKPQAFPDFADWRAYIDSGETDPLPSTPVVMHDAILDGLIAERSATTSGGDHCLLVATRRPPTGGDPLYTYLTAPENITLRNISLRNMATIRINEAKNILIDNVKSITPRTAKGVEDAGLWMRGGRSNYDTSGAALSGIVRDVYIENSNFHGIVIEEPGDIVTENIKVHGFNTDADAGVIYGINYRALTQGGRLVIGEHDVKDAGHANDYLLRLTATGVGSPNVVDLKRFAARLVSSLGTRFNLGGAPADTHFKATNSFSVPSLDTTSGNKTHPLLSISEGDGYVLMGKFVYRGTLAGDASNYASLSLCRNRGGVLETIGSAVSVGNAAVTDGQIFSFAVGIDTHALLQAGDTVFVQATQVGTGVALAPILVDLAMVRY